MPVHLDTTAAMSSSVTSSRRNEPFFCVSVSFFVLGLKLLLQLGKRPKRISAARPRSPCRCRSCGLRLGLLDIALELLQFDDDLFLGAARSASCCPPARAARRSRTRPRLSHVHPGGPMEVCSFSWGPGGANKKRIKTIRTSTKKNNNKNSQKISNVPSGGCSASASN